MDLDLIREDRFLSGMKQSLDDLAARIRREISKSGTCILHQADLMVVWENDGDAVVSIKRMHLGNFAIQYGFTVFLDPDSLRATFRNSK